MFTEALPIIYRSITNILKKHYQCFTEALPNNEYKVQNEQNI